MVGELLAKLFALALAEWCEVWVWDLVVDRRKVMEALGVADEVYISRHLGLII
jgi:hypothetical protein